jgi:hypothetical protein
MSFTVHRLILCAKSGPVPLCEVGTYPAGSDWKRNPVIRLC